MGKHKNAAKGGTDAQKGTSYTPLSHGGEAGDTGHAVHDLRDDDGFVGGRSITNWHSFQDSLQIHMFQQTAIWIISITWALTRSPSTQRSDTLLCPYQSDSRGRGRWPASTFPCIEWFIDCWHVPGWSWRTNYRSCGPCPRGDNLILWMTWSLKEGLLLGNAMACQIQLDRPS